MCVHRNIYLHSMCACCDQIEGTGPKVYRVYRLVGDRLIEKLSYSWGCQNECAGARERPQGHYSCHTYNQQPTANSYMKYVSLETFKLGDVFNMRGWEGSFFYDRMH